MSRGELARQNRPRSRDEEGEEEETCKMQSEEEEEVEVEMFDKKLQSRKASTGSLEKGKRIEEPIELSDDGDENDKEMEMLEKAAKYKEKKMMHDGDHKKKKKKCVSSHGGDQKKTQSGDRDKDKRRDMPPSLNKNKDHFPLKEKSWKMPSNHGGERKIYRGDHHNDNGSSKMWRSNYDKYKGMQKKEMNKDKKLRPVHNGDSREEKKKTSLVISKEGKMPMLDNSSNKGNKRKKATMMYDKVKKPRISDKDEKAGSYDRKKTTPGYNTEQKVQSGHKEKRKVKFAFFKVTGEHFEEFLLIPPEVADEPNMVGFTNQLVCLEDSEGKSSTVRLSVVDGSLAFYQGWNNFVSDHSIKWAEIIVFEYTGRSKFSVRVFGANAWERVSFSVERRGEEKKQKERSRAPDDLVPCHTVRNSRDINAHHYVSGEYIRSNRPKTKSDGYADNAEVSPRNLVAKSMNAVPGTCRMSANSTQDPNRVVGGIVRGSSMAPDNKDGYLVNGKHTTNNIFPSCSKGTTRSPEIIVTDEAPLAQENGDTVALDNKEANLAIGECKTKCNTAVTCNKEKTARFEIVPVTTDVAPLSQENGDAVELTTFAGHIEDAVMMKGSTSEKCAEIDGSDEDLRRKQEGNTVQLECTVAVDKCLNSNKMDTNGNACSKYEYPGGPLCLEKWKEASVSGREALDGTGLIRPENRLKTEEKLVGAMGVNPVERGYDGTHSCVPSQISKTEQSINGKDDTVKPETKMEQVRPMESIGCRQERNNIPVSANRVACQTEHHFFRQQDTKSSNPVPPVPLLPVKAEVSELYDHPMLKANLQFVVPSTAHTRLELPDPLSNVVGRKGRLDRNIVMLKDPMKRLWPVFYHETSVFVGFTGGWKSFVAANKLQTGDLCVLLKDLDEDELVYDVQITRK